jgi:uncharacterized protein (TIGR03085 family)
VVTDPSWARRERVDLCDLLAELGPDAPTCCAGWRTADLAAHLYIRENKPATGLGILLPPFAPYTARVLARTRDEVPYADLVKRVRGGPPRLSLFALPGVDAKGNFLEYLVHHEDVRRAQPGWHPRPLAEAEEQELWHRLRMSRVILRRLPAEISFVWPGHGPMRITKGGKRMSVHGDPAELAMWAVGRTEVAQVTFTGDAEAIDAVKESTWSL